MFAAINEQSVGGIRGRNVKLHLGTGAGETHGVISLEKTAQSAL